MSRFRGSIGIDRGSIEVDPGVWKRVIDDVTVSGEIRGDPKASWSSANMRDSLRVQHLLSIVTPEDDEIDFAAVVYVIWRGRKWSVTALEYKRPRLELTLGGLYNG